MSKPHMKTALAGLHPSFMVFVTLTLLQGHVESDLEHVACPCPHANFSHSILCVSDTKEKWKKFRVM